MMKQALFELRNANESLQGAFFVQKLKYLESTGYVDEHRKYSKRI